MSTPFVRGQKGKIADLTPDDELLVGVDITAPGPVVAVCFGVDAAGRVLDDGWAVAGHQPASPDGSVTYLGPTGGDEHAWRVTLGRLPANLAKVVVAVGLDQAGGVRSVSAGHLRLSASAGEVMRFAVNAGEYGDERALILGEIYKKDLWRVAAVGQGFAGGLPALLDKVGAAHLAPRLAPAAPAPPPAAPPAAAPGFPPPAPAPAPGYPPPAPAAPGFPPPAPAPAPGFPPPAPAAAPGYPPPAPPAAAPPGYPPPPGPAPAYPPPQPAPAPMAAPQPPPAPAPAAPAPAPTGGGVNLGKVTLAKQGEARTVSLRKNDGNYNPLHVNLNWHGNQQSKRRGFLSFGGTVQPPDLDLGCMFEMMDGGASVIQPLGGYFGSAHEPPWILLDKDDRTGAAADGENLYIYRPDQLKRMVVFALIYDGAPDFRSVGAYLTIRDGDGAETVIQLDNPDANRTFCAVAHIANTGNGMEIRKDEMYFTRHRECDWYYQFGFEWSAGSK